MAPNARNDPVSFAGKKSCFIASHDNFHHSFVEFFILFLGINQLLLKHTTNACSVICFLCTFFFCTFCVKSYLFCPSKVCYHFNSVSSVQQK